MSRCGRQIRSAETGRGISAAPTPRPCVRAVMRLFTLSSVSSNSILRALDVRERHRALGSKSTSMRGFPLTISSTGKARRDPSR